MFRAEYGAILASLIRFCGGHFEPAEEALADAWAVALDRWSAEGLPARPAAWIQAVAKRRLVDGMRRRRVHADKVDDLRLEQAGATGGDEIVAEADAFPHDDRLRLIFTCCHPALHHDAQVALTLNTLCGLRTLEIARAFLVREATLAQRLVRAKRKIREADIPYRVPPPELLLERLPAVLGVVYLVFNEGFAATAGDALVRRDLCSEAIRLGRVLTELMRAEPEVHGLLALMLLHDSRRDARTDGAGDSSCSVTRTGRRGTARRSPRASVCSNTRSRCVAPARTRSRPRSRPCTPRRVAPRTLTGARSKLSTTP